MKNNMIIFKKYCKGEFSFFLFVLLSTTLCTMGTHTFSYSIYPVNISSKFTSKAKISLIINKGATPSRLAWMWDIPLRFCWVWCKVISCPFNKEKWRLHINSINRENQSQKGYTGRGYYQGIPAILRHLMSGWLNKDDLEKTSGLQHYRDTTDCFL